MESLPNDTSREVIRRIRSDQLPQLAVILKQLAPFLEAEFFQVRLVLDANVVIRDLRWLCQRTNPEAKTQVMELMTCQVVQAFAPTYLKTEVRRNIPVVAARHGINPDAMRREWEIYQRAISFVEVGGPRKRKILSDPKDTPYLRLQEKLDAIIATEDHHLHAATKRVVRLSVFPVLQRYSRNAAVEFQLKAHAVGAALALGMACEGAVGAVKGIARLPKPLLWILVIALGVAFLHPTSRRKIWENLDSLLQIIGAALGELYLQAEPFLIEHENAKQAAAASRAECAHRLGLPHPV